MNRIADAVTYPAVMVGTLIAFVVASRAGAPLAIASYAPVALAAVAIMILETVRPYRRAWQPDRRSVANDSVFLVLVQMLLPSLLSLLIVLGLSNVSDIESSVRSLWPHGWPVPTQVILMLVVGDMLRYWLHRASHTATFLWSFHAVHHSPKRLYWLNVGRFHPLEKATQFIFDTLPFVLVGVGDDVLAGYFVFYAVNGFFQHSNCRVRLGPLNHLVSGPELHRWHHSRVIAESNNNYGNNLIVWDTLFGTRFFPADREVTELGLLNLGYPDDFPSQMATPFSRGLDKAGAR